MSLSAIAMEPSDSIVGFLKCVMQMLSTVIRNEIRDIRNIKKWHLFSDPTQLSIIMLCKSNSLVHLPQAKQCLDIRF
jgi:hypothetical protein